MSTARLILFTFGVVSCALGASSAAISGALVAGVCLCVNEPNVPAYRDPSDPGSSLVNLHNGDCFVSNGGIFHKDDTTWYEMRDTQNGQIAWVDSFYLNIYVMNTCNSSVLAEKVSHHVPTGAALDCIVYGTTYTHGEHFTLHGLYCTCDDGYSACSATGPNCFSNGIVYREGVAVTTTGSGACTCTQGKFSCNSPVG